MHDYELHWATHCICNNNILKDIIYLRRAEPTLSSNHQNDQAAVHKRKIYSSSSWMLILILIAMVRYVWLLMFDYDHPLRVNCFNTIRIRILFSILFYKKRYSTSIAWYREHSLSYYSWWFILLMISIIITFV